MTATTTVKIFALADTLDELDRQVAHLQDEIEATISDPELRAAAHQRILDAYHLRYNELLIAKLGG